MLVQTQREKGKKKKQEEKKKKTRMDVYLENTNGCVFNLSLLFRSVGHRVKTHKVTTTSGIELRDIKIKDHVVLSPGEDN